MPLLSGTPAATLSRCFMTATMIALSATTSADDRSTEFDHLYIQPPDKSGTLVDWRNAVGLAYVNTGRVIDERRHSLVPLISLSYKDTVYWRGAHGGIWLLTSDDGKARAGVIVRPRASYDTVSVSGRKRRRASTNAGVNGVWMIDRWTVGGAYFTDISGNSDGASALVALTRSFRLNDRWQLAPVMSVEWLDADTVDYYYGVTPAEATAARPAYQGSQSINFRVGVSTRRRLTPDFSLLANVSYTRFGSAITDSPIVTRDHAVSYLIGGEWSF